jgi:hypothetical protein
MGTWRVLKTRQAPWRDFKTRQDLFAKKKLQTGPGVV